MDRTEQNVYLSAEYAEANRYMDNAKDALNKADKLDYGYYKDKKYVKSACGIAYLAVLVALDAWLRLKGIPEPSKKTRKTINYYLSTIAGLDNKMVSFLNTAYDILHLEGYYRGEMSVKAIEAGFDAAYKIIDRIKPEQFVEVKETRGQGLKRVLNNLLISAAVTFR
jgi:hypothetical protein